MRHRYLLSLALSFGALFTCAQTPDGRFFRTSAEIDRAALKHVIQAIGDLDPNAKVLHSDDLRILHVRANPSVTDAELRAAMSAAGVPVDQGTPDLRAYLPEPSADTPPIYVVSGNETDDLARYRSAAEAWNQAHPDRPVAVDPIHTNR